MKSIFLIFYPLWITIGIICLLLSMSRNKSRKKIVSNIVKPTGEKNATPRTAKIVLFVFGVGPLLLMVLFLFSNGFFNSPWVTLSPSYEQLFWFFYKQKLWMVLFFWCLLFITWFVYWPKVNHLFVFLAKISFYNSTNATLFGWLSISEYWKSTCCL